MEQNSNKSKLTLFEFFSMTAVMIVSIYEYPVFATSHFTLVFYLLIGGFFWFTPIALCAAEMATIKGWKGAGIFTWVSNTLGEKWGFAAIFFQWFQVTIGFITVLYFVVGSLSYLLQWPALNDNPLLKFLGTAGIFWILTVAQFKGTKKTAQFTTYGLILGVYLPVLILVILTFFYILHGNPIHVKFTVDDFFPDFANINSLVIMVSFILSYTGIEASAPLINELEDPDRNYPLVMFMLVISAIFLNTLGALSIGIVTPLSKLNLSAGVSETFESLIMPYGKHLLWIVRIIAAALALGSMGEVSAWIIGPTKAMQVTAQKGLVPKIFTKTNRYGVPVPLLIFQAVIVTLWAAVLTLGGGGNALSFMTALSLTVVVYLITYMLLFLGYFVLLFKYPDLQRGYQIPGGRFFKSVVAGIGLFMAIISFIISFFPPSNISDKRAYVMILGISFLITLFLPFVIYHFKKYWK